MKQHLLTFVTASALVLGLSSTAQAALQSQEVNYTHNGQTLQGYLVFDDAKIKRSGNPAVLVFHAWMGIGEHERTWANQLAELGYVAFAPDVYGKGVRPSTPDAAGKEAGKYRQNVPLMRARAQAGLQQLQQNKLVDPSRIGAIGFCFGGGVALELARSGAPIAATVSLHGNLNTPNPADAKQIKGGVLVLHGGDDPYVPAEQVQAFEKEMREANVNWQLNAYGGAVHSFTEPAAGNNKASGAAYHPEAARRSWRDMTAALSEWLKP